MQSAISFGLRTMRFPKLDPVRLAKLRVQHIGRNRQAYRLLEE